MERSIKQADNLSPIQKVIGYNKILLIKIDNLLQADEIIL